MPPKRPAPKSAERTGALFVNLTPAMLNSLDAWVEKLNSGKAIGPQWSRTDLVRAIFSRALDERGAKGEAP